MGQVSQFGSPPRGKTSYWLALAAAGALLLIGLSVATAVSRDEPIRECRDPRGGVESDPTLIRINTARAITCGEAVRVLRRAETALSDAGASFDTLDGMRVRTERGEECDVGFARDLAWNVTCRDGDSVVTGTIVN